MLLPAVQPRRPAMDDRTMPAPRHDRCFRTGCAVALHNLPTNSDHDEVSQAGATAGGDLSFHGDSELAPGLVDLAVNVRHEPRPAWLTAAILDAVEDLSHYPDDGPARQAVADRHGRSVDEVLITAGAAPVFTLLARALAPRRAVLVHPQFTEPEAALRRAGYPVDRVLLTEADGFRLDPAAVPTDADLVVIGNPTNPTSVLHPAATVAALACPGRVQVVDEAFADTVPGEPASLSARRDLSGVVVVRSFTKTWGLAGLRIGYALGPADLIARLAAVCPPWTVSTPALAAAVACAGPVAVAAERAIAERLAGERRSPGSGRTTYAWRYATPPQRTHSSPRSRRYSARSADAGGDAGRGAAPGPGLDGRCPDPAGAGDPPRRAGGHVPAPAAAAARGGGFRRRPRRARPGGDAMAAGGHRADGHELPGRWGGGQRVRAPGRRVRDSGGRRRRQPAGSRGTPARPQGPLRHRRPDRGTGDDPRPGARCARRRHRGDRAARGCRRRPADHRRHGHRQHHACGGSDRGVHRFGGRDGDRSGYRRGRRDVRAEGGGGRRRPPAARTGPDRPGRGARRGRRAGARRAGRLRARRRRPPHAGGPGWRERGGGGARRSRAGPGRRGSHGGRPPLGRAGGGGRTGPPRAHAADRSRTAAR